MTSKLICDHSTYCNIWLTRIHYRTDQVIKIYYKRDVNKCLNKYSDSRLPIKNWSMKWRSCQLILCNNKVVPIKLILQVIISNSTESLTSFTTFLFSSETPQYVTYKTRIIYEGKISFVSRLQSAYWAASQPWHQCQCLVPVSFGPGMWPVHLNRPCRKRCHSDTRTVASPLHPCAFTSFCELWINYSGMVMKYSYSTWPNSLNVLLSRTLYEVRATIPEEGRSSWFSHRFPSSFGRVLNHRRQILLFV